MKSPLIALASLLTASLTAGAWPLVPRSTSLWNHSAQNEYIVFQADNDRPLEIFRGGDKVMQPVVGGQGSYTDLPQFDYDPYYSNWPVGFAYGRGAAGDIDGDGDMDLVRSAIITYNGTPEPNYRIMACLNNGAGQFSRGWQFKQITAVSALGTTAPQVKLADLDRDRDLDLISNLPNLRVHWNPGNGDFGASIANLYTAAARLETMATGDFNGDGWQDIAACVAVAGLNPDMPNWTAGRFVLLTNNAGAFSATTVKTLGVNWNFSQATAADINQDGLMDLAVVVVGDNNGSGIHWFRNTGSGFAPMAALAVLPSNSTTAFDVGDLDEDGRVDIAFAEHEHEIKWLRATGGGAFQPAATLRTENATAAAIGLSIADIDSDGDNDVIIDAGWNVLENTAIHRKPGSQVTDMTGNMPAGAVDLETADVNGDGRSDLIAADGTGKRLLWYPGNGTGLDQAWPVSTSGIAPTSVATGDFNRDGYTDLAWTTPNTIGRAYSTNGSGYAWTAATLGTMTGITRICSSDMDSDGDSDVLAMSSTTVRIYKNDGSGGGWLPENISTGNQGMTSFCAGQEIPGGKLEVAVLFTGTNPGVFSRLRYSGSSWTGSGGAIVNQSGNSKAVIMADVLGSLPGLETIYSINNNAFYIHHPSLAQPAYADGGLNTIYQLAAADWNGDGWIDILSASTGGVNLHLNQRTATWEQSTAVPLYNGVTVQDLVVMDLNADGLPDAVAADATGALHLIYNRSAPVTVTNSSIPVPPASPGATVNIASVTGTNHGRAAGAAPAVADACAAPVEARLRFTRAQLINGAWQPGTAMTQAEVSAAVETVSINAGSSAAAPSGISNGVYSHPVTGVTRTLLCALPGQSRTFSISLKIKSSATLDRFFVEHTTASNWMPLDANNGYAAGASPLDNLNAPAVARTLVNILSPIESWRLEHFGDTDGTGDRANDADFDSDGVPNLVEYVTGTDPAVIEHALNTNNGLYVFKPATLQSPLKFRLAMSPEAMSNSKVRLTVQMSTGLTGWASLTSRTGGGAWSGLQPEFVIPANGVTSHIFTTTYTPQNTKKFFLRLKAEELP